MSLPSTAYASILHRVSGVITFVAVGILLFLLNQSLDSQQSYDALLECFTHPLMKFVVWGIITALLYHLTVGIRHLIMDAGAWEEMESGRLSANLFIALNVVLAAAVGVWLW